MCRRGFRARNAPRAHAACQTIGAGPSRNRRFAGRIAESVANRDARGLARELHRSAADMARTPSELRASILELVEEYVASAFPEKPFVPSMSAVPVSGRVF